MVMNYARQVRESAVSDQKHVTLVVPPLFAVLLEKVVVPPILAVDRNATMAPRQGEGEGSECRLVI